MKHIAEIELFAYREGEMKGREAIAAHLQECGECRVELERIEEVFAALNARKVPDPGEAYGTKVWHQIADRLPEQNASWWEGLFAPRRLMAFGTAVALLAVAFYAGRKTRPPVVRELRTLERFASECWWLQWASIWANRK